MAVVAVVYDGMLALRRRKDMSVLYNESREGAADSMDSLSVSLACELLSL